MATLCGDHDHGGPIIPLQGESWSSNCVGIATLTNETLPQYTLHLNENPHTNLKMSPLCYFNTCIFVKYLSCILKYAENKYFKENFKRH